MNNQCQLGSTEWSPGPATLWWGKPLQQCTVSQLSVRFCELLFMVRNQAANCFMSFLVAANGEKKWASFPAAKWGGSCWSSAWEVSRTEQKGYPPGAAAGATAKQAKVRHKHSLSTVRPGFLCTNLYLTWAWQESVPAGRFHLRSIGKVQIAMGAFCCRGSKWCVCNFNKVVCLKCLVGKKTNKPKPQKSRLFYIYKAVCLEFQIFQAFQPSNLKKKKL